MTVFIYPVLTSQTVNPNILPGIAHAIERYILVNRLDQIMTIARKKYEVDRAGRVHLIEVDARDRETAAKERDAEHKKWLEDDKKREQEQRERDLRDREETIEKMRDVESSAHYNDREKERKAREIWDDYRKRRDDEFNQRKENERRAWEEEKERRERLAKEQDDDIRKAHERDLKNDEQLWKANQEKDRREYEKNRDIDNKAWDVAWDTIKRDRDEKRDRQRSGPAKVDLGRIESSTLALEPTWVKVDTPEGPALVGIKCVPFAVKSDATLAELLLKDRYRSAIEKKIIGVSRRFHRWLFKIFYDKLRGFGMFGRGTLSQHPMKDIIYDRTRFSRTGVFALINRADLDDDFFKSAGGVASLFKLGWNTIIVADDVNKQVYFVAKEFRGSYSVVPYPFIYSGINRDAGQVYDNLEDVRKSAGPLFKRRGNVMKLLGEGMADQAKSRYKTNMVEMSPAIAALQEAVEPLSEDVSGLFKNMKGSQVKEKISSIKKAAVKGDVRTVKTITKFVPKSIAKISTIEKFGKKVMGSDYNKYFKISQRVLSNSLPESHPKEAVDIMASLCAFTAHKQEEPMKRVQESLKIVVGEIRRNSTKAKKETDWEIVSAYILAACALIAFAVPAAAIGVGLISLTGAFPTLAGVIMFFIAITALIWTVRWGPEGDSGPDKLL